MSQQPEVQGDSKALLFAGRHEEWSVEEEFDRPGSWHMERDETLARERLADPTKGPVLRLYSWSPSAVSLGYQQKLESIDLDRCSARGIDVVRRPTGGRAVLHAKELTYAVVMRVAEGQGIYATHNRIVEALLASLESLDPGMTELTITGRTMETPIREVYKPGTITNAACFASSARHEATFRGRKVIGSAQRRFGDVLLQHGSILLTSDHLELPDLLALSGEQRERMRTLLERETATLSDLCGRPIAPEEAAKCVRDQFVAHICAEA